MKSRDTLFLTFCLCLTAGLVWSFAVFNGYFATTSDEVLTARQTEERYKEERRQRILAENRLVDFEQAVASSLPEKTTKDLASQGYDIQNLSSVLRLPASEKLDLSGVVFERAKKSFGDKKYAQAVREFKHMIEDYPTSRYAVEAHFFLAESAFLDKNPKLCLEIVDKMVTQYPDHELTGYILLRMAQISQQNQQTEEASEIYRTVIANFKNSPALVDQAKRLAQALGSDE